MKPMKGFVHGADADGKQHKDETPCWRYGAFAILKGKYGHWVVIHHPTGMMTHRYGHCFARRRDALAFADILAPLTDWANLTLAACRTGVTATTGEPLGRAVLDALYNNFDSDHGAPRRLKVAA